MKVVLTEKPSVARDIARYLKANKKCQGYLEGNGYQVVWAYGHLVTLKEPQDYDPALKYWSLTNLPFIPKKFELNAINKTHTRNQLKIIYNLFRRADEIICATDAGREGELIFRYILAISNCENKRCFRLWLSSLTHQAIHKAFGQIKSSTDYNNLYMAAQCRSQSDWIVGINATRNYTLRYGGKGLLWSIGRVQTPVLAMIVERDEKIENFVSEPFWELFTKYRDVLFKYSGKRFNEQKQAGQMLDKVKGHPFVINNIEHKKERENPPLLYDLTSLQRDMNRRWSLSADATLKTLQDLYEQKFVTYPRTDSRYISSDIKKTVPNILNQLSQTEAAKIAPLDLNKLPFSSRIVNDSKVSDHHAIIPTGKPKNSSLDPQAAKVLDAIITRFIAVFYPPCIKNVTQVEGISNEVVFKAKGVTVVDPGWTVLYPKKQEKKPTNTQDKNQTKNKDKDKEEQQILPAFQLKETGEHQPLVKEKKTQPPKPYTENTLLAAMESAGKMVEDEQLKDALKERGLGTPATRAAIIETLLLRKYIMRQNKAIRATNSGRYLATVVHNNHLKSPQLTGDWEFKLKQVEYGELEANKFMQEITQFIHKVIQMSEEAIDYNRWGNCPLCKNPVIKGRKGYGCSHWKEGCKFVLWPDFQGTILSPQQIRELLQLGRVSHLLTRENKKWFLQLNAKGELQGLAIEHSNQYQKQYNKKTATNKNYTSAKKSQNEQSQNKQPAAKTTNTDKTGIGTCPLCKQSIVKGKNNYECSQRNNGCSFFIPKCIANKNIQSRTVTTLLLKGQTSVLKGFKDSSGTGFTARLELQNGRINLVRK